MKLTIRSRRHTVTQLLRWSAGVLFAGGTLLLAFCGFTLGDSWWFQKSESAVLERQLRATPTTLVSRPETAGASDVVGRIDIETLGISAIVVEGTDSTSLARAVGHIAGTALPGEPGNVGLSAHRDTFFRPLRNIRQDETIKISMPSGVYRYRVVSTRIVRPTDVSVLDSEAGETLTLVTCYPFYFVGPAPRRFIVRAKRVT